MSSLFQLILFVFSFFSFPFQKALLFGKEKKIVNFTNGWCSGPVVCINSQMPPGVLSCDLELLSHLVTAPVNIIDRLKGNLSPTQIQLNSLRANRQFITHIDQLFVV